MSVSGTQWLYGLDMARNVLRCKLPCRGQWDAVVDNGLPSAAVRIAAELKAKRRQQRSGVSFAQVDTNAIGAASGLLRISQTLQFFKGFPNRA